MRAYKNEVWDMFGNYFTKQKIKVFPRRDNGVADSLAMVAGKFKTPIHSQKTYRVKIISRPSLPDNSNYWKFFDDDLQIKRFLEMSDEFVNTQIDTENVNLENF